MTFSEFGRRVEENSSGTDHGTAAPLFVVGDGVAGGLYGEHPSLTDLDNNKNLIRTVDFREVYATDPRRLARQGPGRRGARHEAGRRAAPGGVPAVKAIRLVVAAALALGLAAGAPVPPPPPPAARQPRCPTSSSGSRSSSAAASLNAPDQALRIRPGDTVEWTNLDPVAHSITFEAMPKVLYLKKPGDKASMTFTQSGYYTYTLRRAPGPPRHDGSGVRDRRRR